MFCYTIFRKSAEWQMELTQTFNRTLVSVRRPPFRPPGLSKGPNRTLNFSGWRLPRGTRVEIFGTFPYLTDPVQLGLFYKHLCNLFIDLFIESSFSSISSSSSLSHPNCKSSGADIFREYHPTPCITCQISHITSYGLVMLLARTHGKTLYHGIDKDSWYTHELMVLTTPF